MLVVGSTSLVADPPRSLGAVPSLSIASQELRASAGRAGVVDWSIGHDRGDPALSVCRSVAHGSLGGSREQFPSERGA